MSSSGQSRGGQKASAGAVAAAAQSQQQAQQAQQQAQQLLNTGAIATLDEVQAMDDNQIVQFINQAKQVDMPAFLMDADTQRFVYAAGVNNMPQVVDSKTFKSMDGTELYRTVNDFYDRNTDVGMTSKQIADQTMKGSLSRIGAGVFGDGYYFSNDRSGSKMYGKGGGKSTIMKAKLNSNAKPVSSYALRRMFQNESLNVQKAFGSMSSGHVGPDSRMTAYALWKGYNVIVRGQANGNKVIGHDTYISVLDRGALTFENKVKTF